MKLSTRGRYAVMAMADMAQQVSAGAPSPLRLGAIATRQEISLAYLEQIFSDLRRHGLVQSTRGAHGGYSLAKDATEINVSDIVLAVDEPLDVTRCRQSGACMSNHVRCLTHDLWDNLGRQIETYLQSVSLADVIAGDKVEPKIGGEHNAHLS
ncbi:MAG: Rrf2 family transcriptional regulator [Alphaproteobacteria bacterium]|nr:Rrf2 family transcriptional regulator [Alphaproteobacteria bacterium]MBE8220778.1 Rrf2 family transcriptional regulator [Alphaproteobacteria bacterium]